MKVCLDPGHGGHDPGATGVAGRPEKESNIRVALKAAELLRAAGVQVLLTRQDDSDLGGSPYSLAADLNARCKAANDWGADVFVSLHADWAASGSSQGVEGICSIHAPEGQVGQKLAHLLVDRICAATGQIPWSGASDRGVWARESEAHPGLDYYAVIRGTAMTAVIVERGFLTNLEEGPKLFDEAFLTLQAQAIAAAILEYLGIQPASPQEPAASAQLEAENARLRVELAAAKDEAATATARLARLEQGLETMLANLKGGK